jgi:hypothetical protein
MLLKITNKHIGLALMMRDCGISSIKANPICLALEDMYPSESFSLGMDYIYGSSRNFKIGKNAAPLLYRLTWHKPIKAQDIELEEIYDNQNQIISD